MEKSLTLSRTLLPFPVLEHGQLLVGGFGIALLGYLQGRSTVLSVPTDLIYVRAVSKQQLTRLGIVEGGAMPEQRLEVAT